MVDSISISQNNGLNELQSTSLQQNQQVERVNRESAGNEKSNVVSLMDHANISEAALARLESEKELMKYASLAVRMDEADSSDKVGNLKAMVDNGKINDYLRGLNNDDLASSLLGSPFGAGMLR